jgi:hypothetical protein
MGVRWKSLASIAVVEFCTSYSFAHVRGQFLYELMDSYENEFVYIFKQYPGGDAPDRGQSCSAAKG